MRESLRTSDLSHKGSLAGFTQVSRRRTRRGPKAISLAGRSRRTGIRTRARSCNGTRAGCCVPDTAHWDLFSPEAAV